MINYSIMHFKYGIITKSMQTWKMSMCFGYDLIKGECSVFKKNYIMDENDSLSEYNKTPLGHNRTNGAVYSNI